MSLTKERIASLCEDALYSCVSGDQAEWDELRELALKSLAPEAALMTEERVHSILGDDIKPDGRLYCLGRYLAWSPEHPETACLDADFSALELEAIAWWMKHKCGPQNGGKL